MNCNKCGGELEPGARFCTNCGKGVEVAAVANKPHRKPAIAAAVVMLALVSAAFLFIPDFPSVLDVFGSLSRSKASSLIAGSDESMKLKTMIKLNGEGYKKGIAENIWDADNAKPTDQGLEYLQSDSSCYSYAYLNTPAEIQIEVTGIADSPIGNLIKEAQFTWKYNNVPSVIKRFTVDGGYGTAYFRKYDDGWRLDDMHYQYSDQPAILTSEEIAEEQNDIESIARETQMRQAVEAAEQARLAQLLVVSKTRIMNLSSFEFKWKERWSEGVNHILLDISDVDITVTSHLLTWYNTGIEKGVIWYGDISDISSGVDNNCYFIQIHHRGSSGGAYIGSPITWYFTDKTLFEQVYYELVTARNKWIDDNREVVQNNLR